MIKKEKKLNNKVQIKVCGLTSIEEAQGCEIMGANAIGLVFYPKSPRNVDQNQAKEISASLNPATHKIGVFVNASYDEIMAVAEYCSLTGVQLHGQESRKLISDLMKKNLMVIKTLFYYEEPSFQEAAFYDPSGFLVEPGKGKLPGGNAQPWNWSKTGNIPREKPIILAGGLTPKNVAQAIIESNPDAVDVSSGVESTPGKKDLEKVKSFIHAVKDTRLNLNINNIF